MRIKAVILNIFETFLSFAMYKNFIVEVAAAPLASIGSVFYDTINAAI